MLLTPYLFKPLPGVLQIEPSDAIGGEEYQVVSVALGKRTDRVFIDGQTRGHSLMLREALSARLPTQTTEQRDPALVRPRREPTEEMTRRFREERARRQDEEAFKAEIFDETVNDWTQKNVKSYEWSDYFDVGSPVILLTRKMNDELPRDPTEYWKQLQTRYADLAAIEDASRVGFNSSRTQAVVLVGYVTGVIGGEGHYVLLEKKNGHWKIAHRLRAWIS